jgi:hypothetical protein
VVVEFASVPPPLTVQDTPSGAPLVLLSLVTAAVSVTVWAAPEPEAPPDPSAVVAEAVTATLGAAELPPQPDRLIVAIMVITNRQTTALILRPERTKLFLKSNTGASQNVKLIRTILSALVAYLSIGICHPGFPFFLLTTKQYT